MTQEHSQTPAGAETDCAAALDRLFDYLDGELDGSLEERLKAHVRRCTPCSERAEFERRFLAAVQAARTTDCCPTALRERVISTLRAQGLGT